MQHYRMNRIIKLLENNSFSDVRAEILDPKNDKALRALIDLGCVKPFWADNEIYFLELLNHSVVYGLERQELWINRIVSFLLGVATTLVATALSLVLPL